MEKFTVHPKTRIGHIHLTVSDLERSLNFYRDILGFEVMQKGPGVVFVSAGGYHHTIGLNTWARTGARKPEHGQIGLYHFAIVFPTRKELAKTVRRLIEFKYPIGGAADHGVSEAIYLEDPDGNGVELYVDRDEKEWPRDAKGNLEMVTEELDIEGLLREVKE